MSLITTVMEKITARCRVQFAAMVQSCEVNTFEREAGLEAIVFSYFLSRMYQLGHDVLIIQYSID